MNTLLTIAITFLTVIAFGQSKANRELSQFLKLNKLDTFIIIKSGCSSCIMSYEENARSKRMDTLNIKLLYQKKGNQTFMIFSDTSRIKTVTNVKTDIFNIVANNRNLLRTKDKYYQEQKLAKFQAPCLVTFPYEIIEIKYGTYNYRHTVVEYEYDDCGTNLSNENWFKVEIEILKLIDKLII